MKKQKIFFNPIEGSGALTISWSSGPKGDAIEARRGDGVGFFSEGGDLLCVIFDEVQSEHDHQILKFDQNAVEITVKNGRVTCSIVKNDTPSRPSKRLRQSRGTLRNRF